MTRARTYGNFKGNFSGVEERDICERLDRSQKGARASPHVEVYVDHKLQSSPNSLQTKLQEKMLGHTGSSLGEYIKDTIQYFPP